jgi:NADPH:quinone reductase
VQVAYDPVGGEGFSEALSSLAFAGRLLVVGFASGAIPQLSVNRALIKNVAVLGVRAGEYGRRFPHARRESLAALSALWAAGVLRPKVDCVLPLAQWREGAARISSRACVGRVVLDPAPLQGSSH